MHIYRRKKQGQNNQEIQENQLVITSLSRDMVSLFNLEDVQDRLLDYYKVESVTSFDKPRSLLN